MQIPKPFRAGRFARCQRGNAERHSCKDLCKETSSCSNLCAPAESDRHSAACVMFAAQGQKGIWMDSADGVYRSAGYRDREIRARDDDPIECIADAYRLPLFVRKVRQKPGQRFPAVYKLQTPTFNETFYSTYPTPEVQ